MEGSGMGGAPAAAQAGQVAGGQAGGGEGGADQGPSLADIAQQLAGLSGGQEDLRSYLASQPWQPPEAQEPQTPAEPEPIDLSFLDIADPNFDPQATAERFGSLIEQTMAQREQQLLSQHVQPLQQQLQQERVAREAQMLVDEFPEMGDPDIGPQVVTAARQVAEANGHPDLADQPWFWRTIYMAGRAAQTATEEGAEPPPAAHLEGGAGARPGAQQVDLADQILSASGQAGRSALPF